MKKILILFVIFLSGCINYEQEAKLNLDGSGTMRINYWMKLADIENLKIVNNLGIFIPDSVKSVFSSEFTQVENVEVYSDTMDSTTHAMIEFNFSSIDSLNKLKAFGESDFSLKDGAAGHKIFSQFIAPVATGFGFDGSAFQVRYIYTFPGEIITHNGHLVDKQTLTWEYTFADIGRGKTISVTFRPFKIEETPLWIYLLSGFVLLIVIVFLFSKKR